MSFHHWINSEEINATEALDRIKHVNEDHRHNAWIASQISYEEGVKEGKRLAAKKLQEIIEK